VTPIDKIAKEQAEKIYNEYSKFVYRVALFLTKSKVLADDVSQETFIQAFRNYHMYDKNKPFEPWIYKITVNTSRNMCRKSKWLSFFGSYNDKPSVDTIDDTIFKEHEKADLWAEINKLSLKSREVIVLHYYLDMKLEDVSATLDIPLGTCKSRLNTALTSLRKNLNENQVFNTIKGGKCHEAI
jgi:RNA polymerase sigma-70 factor (ECF subfamily)